jgi:N-acetyl-anhydromuramyl-L-alanine amidase AmpD
MPYSLIWMPEVLLRAGLKVALVPGWEERGRRDVGPTLGVICHHTAGRRTGNMPALNTLINGRSDLPGPLCQLGLGRDGTYYVVAAGRANHAGHGSWNGHTNGNHHFIGIEAENTGRADDQPWPEVQLDAYRRGVAALLSHVGLTASACCGHKEWALPAGRKPDPSFDMARFRKDVDDILEHRAPVPTLIPAVEPAARPEASAPRATLRRGMKDKLVSELQRKLGIAVSAGGEFDVATEVALRAFQRERNLVADGIAGPKTWIALDRVRPGGASGAPPSTEKPPARPVTA